VTIVVVAGTVGGVGIVWVVVGVRIRLSSGRRCSCCRRRGYERMSRSVRDGIVGGSGTQNTATLTGVVIVAHVAVGANVTLRVIVHRRGAATVGV
jgi:hypothetical protein